MNDVTLTIDGQTVTAAAGTTILKAAQSLGESIPTICHHEHCTANALCRICVVEVEGARVLKEEGYIGNYRVASDKRPAILRLTLKYAPQKEQVIFSPCFVF